MAGPSPKMCAACGRRLAPSEVYFRFNLILQGEQDVIHDGEGGMGGEMAALLRLIEQGPHDPREWEEQVHWERTGVICATCRSVVMRTLSPPSDNPGPH